MIKTTERSNTDCSTATAAAAPVPVPVLLSTFCLLAFCFDTVTVTAAVKQHIFVVPSMILLGGSLLACLDWSCRSRRLTCDDGWSNELLQQTSSKRRTTPLFRECFFRTAPQPIRPPRRACF